MYIGSVFLCNKIRLINGNPLKFLTILILVSLYVLQFDGFIDLDSYDTIALKIKGDGRSYISTVNSLSLCLLWLYNASFQVIICMAF